MRDDRNPDHWYDYPSYLASVRERAQAQRQERARAELRALTSHRPGEFQPLAQTVPPVPASVTDFRLDPPRAPRHQSARSKSVDGLLKQVGIR
jgi:hypothetical protein